MLFPATVTFKMNAFETPVQCVHPDDSPCATNEVKIDRAPKFTHWGKIDSRTGIDQRAEVGLLSRNVRFYGEMDHKG